MKTLSKRKRKESDSDSESLHFKKMGRGTRTRESSTEYYHDHASAADAIELNNKLQEMLLQYRCKLKNMIEKCKKKYEENQIILCSLLALKKKKAGLYANNSCGAPYFKDELLFSAPPNNDYLQRKKIKNELFPFDLCYPQRYWYLRDKIGIINGVRQQAVEYLSRTKRTSMAAKFNSKKLVQLLEEVGDDFNINWYRISVENVNGLHPENTCLTMWEMYLKPTINRKKFSPAEIAKLNIVVRKYNYENWQLIAAEFTNRTEYQCFLQFQLLLAKELHFGNKWTKEEDRLLKVAVENSRIGNLIRWNKVVTHFPHKTRKQVYGRYKNSIDPSINKGKFTKKEDCLIMAAVQQYGEKFSHIPKTLFPGRTLVQVRNRYNNVLKINNIRKQWSVEDDKKLLDLVKIYGLANWRSVADNLECHSRTSCRTRYYVIDKYFQKHPNAKIEDIPRKNRNIITDVNEDNWHDTIMKIEESKDVEDEDEKSCKPERPPKKETYRDKLRPIEREFYEFFKLSYNFKFGTEKICRCSVWNSLKMLTNLFGMRWDYSKIVQQKKKFHPVEFQTIKTLTERINYNKIRVCIIESNLMLPPSWCTIVGWRNLQIKVSDQANNNEGKLDLEIIPFDDTISENTVSESTEKSSKNVTVNTDSVNLAKKRFRERFFAIFYKTALLSKIEIPDKRSIEVQTECGNFIIDYLE